ncbi:MAG: Crp/Fnr family transcriptional regulator [Bacteroidota bacterium]
MSGTERPSKFWYLKHFNIFEGMDDASMKQVNDMSSMTSVRSQQPLYFPDQPTQTIFFLKEGHVKISRLTEDGKEMILDVLGPGEIFGELSFSGSGESSGELAQALDDTVICTMKKEDFESLLRTKPELNFELTKRIGLRLRRFEERVSEMVFKDVRKRIAAFLVRYAEDFGKIKGGIITIRMHLSHQEIALLVGAARQTVTSTLNEFRSKGLIDFSRQGFTIKQLSELQKLSR